MSELMDEAVIKMPYEMAMAEELSRRQFYGRANSILDELTTLRAELDNIKTSWALLHAENAELRAKLAAMES